ncbi:MAG: ankyrin repeat domain-containing protein [Candidatus Cloacimonadaceae bacterium]|nr:ankyrin repeat domain-containing protein [Candidatus Cloacimonadaceae bacterium]
MRKIRLHRLVVTVLLLMVAGGLLGQSSRATRARERLEMYEIPFTVDAFLEYVGKNNSEVVQRFVDAGIDVNAANAQGDRALIIAAEKGSIKIVNILLKAGANINIGDADGSTALMYAAHFRKSKMVKHLIRRKADVNKQNKNQMTALMYAVIGGDIESINEMLTKETNTELKNIHGKTAIDIANDLGYNKVADYIKSKMDYLHNRQTPEKKQYELELKRLRRI